MRPNAIALTAAVPMPRRVAGEYRSFIVHLPGGPQYSSSAASRRVPASILGAVATRGARWDPSQTTATIHRQTSVGKVDERGDRLRPRSAVSPSSMGGRVPPHGDGPRIGWLGLEHVQPASTAEDAPIEG